MSTDKQAKKELSIPAQLDTMRQHAQSKGWKVVGHFVDRGESAKTANRPELKRLLAHCKEQKGVDIVVVHKLDRLARNLADYATIKFIFKRKGIRLVSVSEPFEDNAAGQLLEHVMASFAEYYSANLGDEIRKANLAKLKQGEWPHKPPIGYKSVHGEHNRVAHVPDEATAPLIRQAFELFSLGNHSLKTVSEEMFERGLATRYGRMYSEENMKRILSREFYIGRLMWHGEVYRGKHQPIVPKDLFSRVQEVLRRRSVDTGEKGKLPFLLRGVTYCRMCKRRLTGEVHHRGSYYRCLSSLDQTRCTQPYIQVKRLDSQLADLYDRLQLPPGVIDLLRAETEHLVQRRKRLANRESAALHRSIAEIEQKELRLLDEMLAGRVTNQIYEKMAKAYREKRERSETRLAGHQVNYDQPLAFLEQCAKVASTLGVLHRRFTFEQQKDLLRAVFKRIEVEDGVIVGAELNPPFSFLVDDVLAKAVKRRPDGKLPTGTSIAASTKGLTEDRIEQVARFAASSDYGATEKLLKSVMHSPQGRTALMH